MYFDIFHFKAANKKWGKNMYKDLFYPINL